MLMWYTINMEKAKEKRHNVCLYLNRLDSSQRCKIDWMVSQRSASSIVSTPARYIVEVGLHPA